MKGLAGTLYLQIVVGYPDLNGTKKPREIPRQKNELCNELIFNDFLVEFDTTIAVYGSDKVHSFL